MHVHVASERFAQKRYPEPKNCPEASRTRKREPADFPLSKKRFAKTRRIGPEIMIDILPKLSSSTADFPAGPSAHCYLQTAKYPLRCIPDSGAAGPLQRNQEVPRRFPIVCSPSPFLPAPEGFVQITRAIPEIASHYVLRAPFWFSNPLRQRIF